MKHRYPKSKGWQRCLTLSLAAAMTLSLASPAFAADADDGYIKAPYEPASTMESQEYLEPVIYENGEGEPSIGVTTVGVIQQDGKYFRDSDNDKELDPFEDWRLSTDERVKDLLSKLSLEQRAGQVMIHSALQPAYATGQAPDEGAGGIIGALPGNDDKTFVSGILGTSVISALDNNEIRHGVIRNNPSPSELALFNNAMQQVTEYLAATGEDTVTLPYINISNQRNHSGKTAVGFSEATGIFATYPGTQGLTAAAIGMEEREEGSGYEMISTFADESRQEWVATGIRKAYMYMADVTSDPRWTRGYETWGEDPDVVAEIISRLVIGFQNGSEGVNEGSVAMTVKHFPGGGARENGTDPHKENGRWNVYATENSLATYHLPSFQAAVDANVGSIMPYYAIAAGDERSATQVVNGYTMTFDDQKGMAYSPEILETLLRGIMGFEGYVNSDTGITEGTAWGIDKSVYDTTARVAMAINAGTDIISGQSNLSQVLEAVKRAEAKAGGEEAMKAYCEANELVYEDVKDTLFSDNAVLTEERLNEAVGRVLGEAFDLGVFDNAYVDPDNAEKVVSEIKATGHAYDVQQKSAVLLKNDGATLPMTTDKADGKKVYVTYLDEKGNETTTKIAAELKTMFESAGYTMTDDPSEAAYAYFFIDPIRYPSSGTTGYVPELVLGENMEVPTINDDAGETGNLSGETMSLTTVAGFNSIATTAETVHQNGGKVIALLNMNQTWIVDNLEPNCDALIVHFDTQQPALLDVISGKVDAVGRLPVSMPANYDVVELHNETLTGPDGKPTEYAICASPNDVPGYDKDKYMDADVLATTSGNSYVYKDSAGNSYKVGFGLSYDNYYIPAPYEPVDDVESQVYLEPVVYENGKDEPSIAVTTVGVIYQDGKYFKDSDNDKVLDPFEDWRLSTDERVKDLVEKLPLDQKAGQVMINTLNAAIASGESPEGGAGDLIGGLPDPSETDAFVSGLIPESGLSILVDNQMRHTIQRANPSPSELALYNNALQQTAEYLAVTGDPGDVAIPVVQTSNQRNHSGQAAVGFSEATGIFATYPGTLGLTAAALGMEAQEKGSGYDMISTFADQSRQEWVATGIRKAYMYMADVTSDPRWTRAYETWGEKPDVVAEIMSRLVIGFQNGSEGVNEGSVAMTVKHFPGGGARENGTDPHKENGRWNVYATENSLATYHLPSFQAAVDANVGSIMPYYAIAAGDERSATQVVNGYTMTFDDQKGMAYSPEILQKLLREIMGFEGYVNSDTGITNNMAWGVDKEVYDMPARIAMAINAGTDIISGATDLASVLEAVERAEAKAGGEEAMKAYCTENGLVYEDVKDTLFSDNAVLTEERLDEAATRLLSETIALGVFDNPYTDPDNAEKVVSEIKATGHAYEIQQKSAVLLKNTDKTLPMTAEKAKGKLVYATYMDANGDETTTEMAAELVTMFENAGYTMTSDPAKADYAYFFLDPIRYPSKGTEGYVPELRLGEDLDVPTINDDSGETGNLSGEFTKMTTLKGFNSISTISDKVHANGGKVIALLNINNMWIVDNLEPDCDALIAHFDTQQPALLDVISGKVEAVGKLPVSLPANYDVVKLHNETLTGPDGEPTEYAICASPNDVPGYDKDKYMDADVLATTSGNSYTYKDSEGNYYGVGFGLTYSDVQEPDDGGNTDGGNTGDTGDTGTTTPPVVIVRPAFNDIANQWYTDAANYVGRNGIMSGVGGGRFDPNGFSSRAMVAQVIYNMEGSPATTGVSGFTDVLAGQWYTDAVTWNVSAKIVSGYGNGLFGTNDNVTREQLVVLLYRYAQYKGYGTSASGSLAAFVDSASVSDWATQAMSWAVANGIINGKDGARLDPQGTATRAEMAKILMVFCQKIAQ